jgi:hypothetical protein
LPLSLGAASTAVSGVAQRYAAHFGLQHVSQLAMDLNDVLHRVIPYRLAAVETLNLVLCQGEIWSGEKPLQLYIGSKLVVEGNARAFTNPVVESGIIHCRALLEFLGLCMSKAGKLENLKRPRKSDDVGIEHFSTSSGPLPIVAPSGALARWPGGPEEAEQSLLSVFRTANKGLAHFTSAFLATPEEARLIEIATLGVPALVVSYLYTPLGLPPPQSQIKARRREAA